MTGNYWVNYHEFSGVTKEIAFHGNMGCFVPHGIFINIVLLAYREVSLIVTSLHTYLALYFVFYSESLLIIIWMENEMNSIWGRKRHIYGAQGNRIKPGDNTKQHWEHQWVTWSLCLPTLSLLKIEVANWVVSQSSVQWIRACKWDVSSRVRA